jgi:hypothetical protein
MPYWISYSTGNWRPAENRNTLAEARALAEKTKQQWMQWNNVHCHWRIHHGSVLVDTSELDRSKVGKET